MTPTTPAFATMDGAGYGHYMAVPAPLTKGWHGYSAPYRWRSPSWRGTVAMPALTSAIVGGALCPRRLPVRPKDGGAACQWVDRRQHKRPEDGPVGVGPLELDDPSHGPRAPLIRQDGEWRQRTHARRRRCCHDHMTKPASSGVPLQYQACPWDPPVGGPQKPAGKTAA